MSAPVPPNETERLSALREYNVLDTAAEADFDHIAQLAAEICNTPVALVSFVDCHRQWFKAKIGIDLQQTSRDVALCSYAILQPDIFIIPDTLEDPRFADNPMVKSGPKIRFYAGAPLLTPKGVAVGALCVKDYQPRTLTEDQQRALKILAHQVVVQLELRRAKAELETRVAERTQQLQKEILESQKHLAQTRIFAELGNSLGGTSTPLEAATVFMGAAKKLFGWDACFFHLYCEEKKVVTRVLHMDAGEQGLTDSGIPSGSPSPMMRKVMSQGALLISSRDDEFIDVPLMAFGNKKRYSRSLIFAPLIFNGKTVGVCSIQSYKAFHYRKPEFELFQALAGHCSATISRIQNEQALKEREGHFRSLLENGSDIISIMRIDGTILYESPSVERVFGIKPDELSGKQVFDFVHPLDRPGMFARLKNFLTSDRQTSNPIQLRWKHANGSWRTIETICRKSAASNGDPILIGNSRDITERVLAEQKQAELAAIIAATPELVGTITPGGQILHLNQAGLQLLGRNEQDLKCLSVQDCQPQWAASLVLHEGIPAAIESGVWSRETAFLTKSGAEFPAHQTILAHKGSDGEVSFISTIARDISERKRSENELHLLNAIIRSVSEAHFENEALEKVLQLICHATGWHLGLAWSPAGQPLQLKACAYYHQPQFGLGPFLKHSTQTLFAMGEGLPGKVWKTKQPIWVLDFSENPFYPRRKTAADVGIAAGVGIPVMVGDDLVAVFEFFSTDARQEDLRLVNLVSTVAAQVGVGILRKRAEEDLRTSEERFAKAFQASPMAMCLTTLQEGRFLDVNDCFLRMLNLKREEVIGRNFVELNLWAEPHAGSVLQNLSERKTLRDQSIEFRARDGRLVKTICSGEIIKLRDESCLLLVSQDVSEKANLEQQLRQVQKIESVGQLAAGIAHDFNNVLTIIDGYCGLLKRNTQLPQTAIEAVAQISSAAERAANLTRQLLTFSRRQVMQPSLLHLNEIVSGVARILGRVLGEHITIDLNLSSSSPQLSADPGMLEQVIMNLAVNSRDAMPNGGNLVISTEQVQVDEDYARQNPEAHPGNFVCLTVTDTGNGIPPQHQGRIFEPFFTTKEVGKGTGLGLATVYGIVKQHGGWIELSSHVGLGTTFRLFFPSANEVPTSAPQTVKATETFSGKETILVVEDEPVLREMVCHILEQYGYNILSAANGPEALRIWSEHSSKVDLLLTDMVMPEGLTGPQLAKKLLTDRPDLKVIYTTGYSPEAAGGGLKLHEGYNFLPKPYPPSKLAKIIRERLQGQ